MPAPTWTGRTTAPPIIPIMPTPMTNITKPAAASANYYYYFDDDGNPIDPRQYITGGNHFKKMSQELRVAIAGRQAVPGHRRRILPASDQRHPPGISRRQSGRRSVGQRPPGAHLADQAEAHRPRLCAVRRGQLRHHAANHADRRRPLLQVQQYRVRFRRLRPQPGVHSGRGQRRYPPERRRQHQDRRRAMLHDQRRFAARFAIERHGHDADPGRRPARDALHQRRPISRTARSSPSRARTTASPTGSTEPGSRATD